MMYTVRIEPKRYLSAEDVKRIIAAAFEEQGGLFIPGVEIIGED